MTRKHVEAVAAALKGTFRTPAPWTAEDQHSMDCAAVADALVELNRGFDRVRFLRDCGVYNHD